MIQNLDREKVSEDDDSFEENNTYLFESTSEYFGVMTNRYVED
jgi:hypothetical protein